MRETRTVHYRLDPALRAYLEYLERTGRTFSLAGLDLFRANYCADVRRPTSDGQGGRGGA